MQKKNRLLLLAPWVLLVFTPWACTLQKSTLATQQFDTIGVKIQKQHREELTFNKGTLFFSNNFPSARFNRVLQVNDSTFTIDILPENTPINSSAWYAFKLWGVSSSQQIHIQLRYPTGKHRYQPKLRQGNAEWINLPDIRVAPDKSSASFALTLGKDTVTIAAQEIINSAQSYKWLNDVSKKYKLKKTLIGYSIAGKPIYALNTTQVDGRKWILILSRQHPPETTGYMAMQAFVERLLLGDIKSKQFLEEYELVVLPMLNPDGVDEGNWRHNFAGVDLNRDWTGFRQPETRAVRDFLLQKLKKQKAKVLFALDFHSTFKDVLYVNTDRPDTNMPGLCTRWIKRLHELEGAEITPVSPSGNGGNVSKAWLNRELNAEALTYEVGDNTPRAYLKEKAEKLAEILMDELKP